jgi:hypothetical protein
MKRKSNRALQVTELDDLTRQIVRIRDTRGLWASNVGTECISCKKVKPCQELQVGHFMPRGRFTTRWVLENVNLQCVYCNGFLKGNQFRHGRAIDEKFGEGTADRLTQESNKIFKDNLGDWVYRTRLNLVQISKLYEV